MIFGDGSILPQPAIPCHLKLLDEERKKLNEHQLAAVREAAGMKDFFLLHGPPGTGKSTTIGKRCKFHRFSFPKVFFIIICIKRYLGMIIADQVRRGHNVLITCPSHAAVDSLLEKLASLSLFSTKDILRLGHLAKVKKELHKYCLDYKVFGKAKRFIKRKKQRKVHEAEFLRDAKVVLGTCTTPAPEGKLDFYNEVSYMK